MHRRFEFIDGKSATTTAHTIAYLHTNAQPVESRAHRHGIYHQIRPRVFISLEERAPGEIWENWNLFSRFFPPPPLPTRKQTMRLGTKNERWLGHRAELGSRGYRTERVASNVNGVARVVVVDGRGWYRRQWLETSEMSIHGERYRAAGVAFICSWKTKAEQQALLRSSLPSPSTPFQPSPIGNYSRASQKFKRKDASKTRYVFELSFVTKMKKERQKHASGR